MSKFLAIIVAFAISFSFSFADTKLNGTVPSQISAKPGVAHFVLFADKSNFNNMVKFYNAVNPIIGLDILNEIKVKDTVVSTMYGQGVPQFVVSLSGASVGGNDVRKPTTATHFAFFAASRSQVDNWYKVALSNGGKDNGKPGLRTQYASNYYAAFIVDPAGNNVEVVTFSAK